MKLKSLTVIILLILTITLFAGCNNEPLKPQAVVLNVRKISEVTGINDQIEKHKEAMIQQISEEINALSAKLTKELEDENSGLDDDPSEEDMKKIQAVQRQWAKQIAEARLEGNERLAKEQSDIEQSFLDDIILVAQKVALEYGASIILKDMGVLWSDGSVDITDEVIGRMLDSKDPQPADGDKTE